MWKTKLFLVLAIALLGVRHLVAEEHRPNIVVILADDFGVGDIQAHYPDNKILTPYLDRLVSQGMSFTDAHSPSAVCSPTRYGLLTGRYAWRTRMQESFETIHRRVQTSAYKRLHRYVENGELTGFVLPYLGQQDNKLPFCPPDLIPREQVITYPTNFSAMSKETINMLSLRGEQLTRLLVARYTPEL